MSTLQYELMQTTSGLSEESLRIVLDYVRTFIVPFDGKMKDAAQAAPVQAKPRRIGSRKGVKFVADGHDIADYNDEIEELFGVSD